MIAGIITTPNRQEHLYDLVKLIAPYVRKLIIFNDIESKGHTQNMKQCMKTCLQEAYINEPVLIMCDDVVTVPDWYERFEDLHREVGHNIYTFMSRQRHLFTEENIQRGYVKGLFKKGFYDHAVIYINQFHLVDDIDDWFRAVGKKIIPLSRQKHYDVIIQEYLIANGFDWVLTTPTLFDHIGNKSNFNHDIGGSYKYIGNI